MIFKKWDKVIGINDKTPYYHKICTVIKAHTEYPPYIQIKYNDQIYWPFDDEVIPVTEENLLKIL